MQGPIYLVGYMCAGKTTVGRLLAEQLGWQFVDLDEAFAHFHHATPADYIRAHGIDAFRRKEKFVLEDLAELQPHNHIIYATGGGYPCYEDNMECLRELGTSIYLKWQPKHLVSRMLLTNLEDRPVLQGRTAEELMTFILPQLEAREPFYKQANYTLEVDDIIGDAISEQDDQLIADELYRFIKAYHEQ